MTNEELLSQLKIPFERRGGVLCIPRAAALSAFEKILGIELPIHGYDSFTLTQNTIQPDMWFGPDWSGSRTPSLIQIGEELSEIPDHITHIEIVVGKL